MPARKPPTCAQKAIPPEFPLWAAMEVAAPLRNCATNQYPRTTHAGSHTKKTKNNGTSVSTRERGYRMKYAPITPAMAPLAPTVGMVELAFSSVWNMAAATPHVRENTRYHACPTRSSTLSPKTHSAHMLKMRASHEPCRNIEVKIGRMAAIGGTKRVPSWEMRSQGT